MAGSARGEPVRGKGWRSGSFNVEGVGFNLWEGSFLILLVGSDGWLREGSQSGERDGGVALLT